MHRIEEAQKRLEEVLKAVAVHGSARENKGTVALACGYQNVTESVKDVVRDKWRDLFVNTFHQPVPHLEILDSGHSLILTKGAPAVVPR